MKNQLELLKNNWLLVVLFILLFIASNAFNSYQPDQSRPYLESASMLQRSDINREDMSAGTVRATVESNKVDEASEAIKDSVEQLGGYILNENVETEEDKIVFSSLHLEVPDSAVPDIRSLIEQQGEITNYQEQQLNVREQSQDLQTRLEAEKQKLKRLQDLYNDSESVTEKSNLIDQLVSQERLVSRLETQSQDISDDASYSNVYINIQKKPPYITVQFVGFQEMANGLLRSLNALLLITVYILPWAIFGGIAWWIYNRKQ